MALLPTTIIAHLRRVQNWFQQFLPHLEQNQLQIVVLQTCVTRVLHLILHRLYAMMKLVLEHIQRVQVQALVW